MGFEVPVDPDWAEELLFRFSVGRAVDIVLGVLVVGAFQELDVFRADLLLGVSDERLVLVPWLAFPFRVEVAVDVPGPRVVVVSILDGG